jgi:hypothetical protein
MTQCWRNLLIQQVFFYFLPKYYGCIVPIIYRFNYPPTRYKEFLRIY